MHQCLGMCLNKWNPPWTTEIGVDGEFCKKLFYESIEFNLFLLNNIHPILFWIDELIHFCS